ncbi:hypothetical protein CF67_14016 [Candidatus Photodesmus blepharus]|uniref:Rhodanese domain-containing protein n=1 Tax=Candidatus Photodesmus blepharonis TaxID=1179155 RepID=A0A084CP63_9GAMM|nr:rhodanese-like domain-containing protein [Candidatus Photodesmus blepharus]KEY91592.1 hypothetical protein CF67_14016 [Candidatus Photodesmus blepharus]
MQEYIDFFQQNMILSLVWIALFSALFINIVKSLTATYKLITVSEIIRLINRENGVVLDVRSKDEFKKGHIIDAINLSPSEIKSGNFGSIEHQKSIPIIVVCKTGQIAQESASVLAKLGFKRVHLLKNGLLSWNEANIPLVRDKG